ncbi:B3 domain-containing protein At2g31420-like [Neltuma alba]|uniref:B3 domain-containing protein At2g31420-like n=1 Tax=Neltuma alba TaxID=207710 RepID=UPI0010A55678|nr:B3 domain-containing protein At2g31420-like [Prosopis alba]
MSNQLTLEDFKDIKLNPNATPFEVLVVVAQVARQKLRNKANSEAYSSSSSSLAEGNNAQPVPPRKKRKKSSVITHNNGNNSKTNHLEITSEEWIRKFTEKKRREDILDAPPLPEEFEARIIEKCGGTRPNQIIHIYQKTLYGTDVNKQHGRLTMCCNKIESFEFMKDDEITRLRLGGDIKVPLIHKPKEEEEEDNGVALPPLSETTLTFKQWDLHKSDNDPQKISYQYVLNGGWNRIVFEDKLEKGHTIDVWAFRDSEDMLCMALIKRE